MPQKVLIIDDAPPIHPLVKAHASPNLEWFSAYDGEQGMVMAMQTHPDLILLDVDMPNMRGFEVCRRLKLDPETRQIPILFLTGASTVDEKVRGLEVGAVDYVTKPFDPCELRARMKVALHSKYLVDQLSQKSMVDELTGLFNRAYFDRHLRSRVTKSRRSASPLACILLQIDGFAELNTRMGRVAGEAALRSISLALEQTCREEDTLCRYDDDMFAVVLEGDEPPAVVKFADRLRQAVAGCVLLFTDEKVSLTCSVGAGYARTALGQPLMLTAATALTRAERAGGNCVKFSGEMA